MTQANMARRRERGIVYVETLVALPVVVYFTMVLLQLIDYFGAVILTKHAAICAARAAAVVGPDDPKYYGGQPLHDLGGGMRLAEVRKAALLALHAKEQFRTASFALDVVPARASLELVTVRLAIEYRCAVPYMNVVCGMGPTRTIRSSGMFPYQSRN